MTAACGTPPPVAVFPGAGSFGGEFRPLQQQLGRRVRRIRYPGRFDDDSCGSFGELVRLCAGQVRALDGPALLLGHSFGAYVAFAVAVRLTDRGSPPGELVVLGAAPPTDLDVSEFPADTTEDTAAYLRRVDPGRPADLPSDDWHELVVDAARADMRLLRQFDPPPGRALCCPVVAVRGATDPLASEADTRAWHRTTTGPATVRTFAGGHSDYIGSPDFVSWVHGLSAGR